MDRYLFGDTSLPKRYGLCTVEWIAIVEDQDVTSGGSDKLKLWFRHIPTVRPPCRSLSVPLKTRTLCLQSIHSYSKS